MPITVRSFLCITLVWLCHSPLRASPLSIGIPQSTVARASAASAGTSDANAPVADGTASASAPELLPDAPDADIPTAAPVPLKPRGTAVRIQADEQSKVGDVYTLNGNILVTYRDYTLRADKARYDQETGEVEAEGHVQLQGGADDELIQADHATVNLELETARLYDVTGTVGVRPNAGRKRVVYTTANPLIFTGRVVLKSGPERYQVIEGTMTSCRLPTPDWRLSAGRIDVDGTQASARNALFRIRGLPLFFLPYVTHPVEGNGRQSGLLIPVYSNSSIKGTVVGEQLYVVLGRSMDLTMGADFYSKRGWAPSGEFRYRGLEENFAELRFTALFDRGVPADQPTPPGGRDQGGQDVLLNGRYAFGSDTRLVANAEYLSSFIYREAFAESFAQAVASQVNSNIFVTDNRNGYSTSVNFNRYASYTSLTPGQDIVISHLPSLQLETEGRRLARTPLLWTAQASLAGLSRHEPFFRTAHEVGRVDLYPALSLPLQAGGWSLVPEVAVRDTFYSKSQAPTFELPPGQDSLIPIYRSASANRKDFEGGLELRPPVLEREFAPDWLVRRFGRTLRHTIEPAVQYRYVSGIGNFANILRFDPVDTATNTNQVEYSLTQRFFLRRTQPGQCENPALPAAIDGRIFVPQGYRECAGATSDTLTWRVAQEHYFDPSFGGAVVAGRRNVTAPALDFTGISFLTGPRNASPIISRLALHTDQQVDFGWDVDYDPKAGRINASNEYVDLRHENIFAGFSHSRLDELNAVFNTDPASQITNYNQMRLLLGYGSGVKPGLSAGLNAGYDLHNSEVQYAGFQTSYNWSCCGLTLEYRRLALGPVRNENYESFNFTLAGVGTAGNINRSQLIY